MALAGYAATMMMMNHIATVISIQKTEWKQVHVTDHITFPANLTVGLAVSNNAKVQSTYDRRLIYKTSDKECKAKALHSSYDSLAKSQDCLGHFRKLGYDISKRNLSMP